MKISNNLNMAAITQILFLCSFFGLASSVIADPELPMLGENSSLNLTKEIQLGKGLFNRLSDQGYVIDDPLLSRYLQDIGESLLASLDVRVRDYHFYLIKENSINAFAAPGGYIGVNSGLIAISQTEDELASVLAHEIAHVELMHSMQMIEKAKNVNLMSMVSILAAILVASSQDVEAGAAIMHTGVAGSIQSMINFTRENEYEADRLGVEVLKKSDYNPEAMADFMKILQSHEQGGELAGIEYLRTHPVNSNRIAEIVSRISTFEKKQPKFTRFQQFKDYLFYLYPDGRGTGGNTRFSVALGHMHHGRYGAAQKIYQELLENDPDSLWFNYAMAENLEFQKRLSEAEKIYQSTLLLYPEDMAIAARLVNVLLAQGQPDNALEIALQVYDKQKKDPEIYQLLVKIYEKLEMKPLRELAEAKYHWLVGNKKHARTLFKKLIANGELDTAEEEWVKEKLSTK